MRIHYFLMLALALGCTAAMGCGDDDGDDDDDTADTGPTGDTGPRDTGGGDTSSGDTGGGDSSMMGGGPYHDCDDDADFMTGDTIRFGGTPPDGVGLMYSPRCLKINAGDSVTFNGNFTTHPLTPGVAPGRASMDPAAPASNPITSTNMGMTAEFTFPNAGDYPFFCMVHSGSNMIGVIRVED